MLIVDSESGLLSTAEIYLSPNHNERPDESDVSLLLVHGISLPSGEFGGDFISDFFLNRLDHDAHRDFSTIRGVKVSAHLLIRRDGHIIQYVPLNKRAWHAGVSSFQGRANCNDYSIGVELEGTDNIDYTDAQYQQLAKLSCQLLKVYPKMNLDRIVGHSDVAPGRKTDPGPAFKWTYFRELLTKEV